MKEKLTQSYLKECLTYDPMTGIFVWNERPISHFKNESDQKALNAKLSGKEAGSVESLGYIQIGISRKLYLAHRLAFLYMEGYFPENLVDHIDKNPSNNKWSNLREASNQCNLQNCKLSSSNTSGVCGVSWDKRSGKWESYMMISFKKISLGTFDNLNDAVMARYKEEINNPLWSCSNESSAYNYLRDKNLLDIFKNKDFARNNLRQNNKSGVTGVTLDKKTGKYDAYRHIKKRKINLGRFKNFEDAVKARYEWEINSQASNPDIESSAYRYLVDHKLI